MGILTVQVLKMLVYLLLEFQIGARKYYYYLDSREQDLTTRYSTGSPDEEALVRCAAKQGVELVARENNTVTVKWHGVPKIFTILQILEFNSYRKRMSVIAQREEDGALLVSSL